MIPGKKRKLSEGHICGNGQGFKRLSMENSLFSESHFINECLIVGTGVLILLTKLLLTRKQDLTESTDKMWFAAERLL